jgi:uncharacterized membrane-anchored protein
MKLKIAALTSLFVLAATLAQAKPYQEMFPGADRFGDADKAILEKIDFQQGAIKIPGANATLDIPEQFYYLSPADARRVIVDIWGNPPQAGEGTMGMVFPAKYAPVEGGSWGSVVEYSADGYVSDVDAASTDYDELLQNIKDSIAETNPEREKQGFEKITLVGWASPPHYDQSAHALHWARDLIFGNDMSQAHTLNYSVRVFGREGVFMFNFVAGMDQLKEIQSAVPDVLTMVRFDSGKTYKDYESGDKLAAYGMAGMIAAGAGAKVAAKVGLLAMAAVFFKKAGVLVLVAGAALLRALKGMFSRKKPSA